MRAMRHARATADRSPPPPHSAPLRFTDRRLSVQATAPWKKEQTDVAYQEVRDVITVGRGVGLWGDMVVTLKDGSKVEIRSLDRCAARRPPPAARAPAAAAARRRAPPRCRTLSAERVLLRSRASSPAPAPHARAATGSWS
jgi:hypothetical protein